METFKVGGHVIGTAEENIQKRWKLFKPPGSNGWKNIVPVGCCETRDAITTFYIKEQLKLGKYIVKLHNEKLR